MYFCHCHLLSQYHLQIKPSSIPNIGKGLFAINKRALPNMILFCKDDKICDYDGELIHNNDLNERYGLYTAPYGLQLSNRNFLDSACSRGVGSLINHHINHGRINARFSVHPNRRSAVIKATKNIYNGEEIFVDYGNSYAFNEADFSTKYKQNRRR